MFSPHDHALMAHALRLAAHGLATTQPNPRVGCVIARDGEVVGEGWHRRAGEAHGHTYVNGVLDKLAATCRPAEYGARK